MKKLFFYALVATLVFARPASAQLWYHSHGGSGANGGQDIATDAAGNIYVTGDFAGTVNFATTTLVGAGGQDAFIAKYSKAGTFLWAKSAGGTSQDEAHSIYTDPMGNSYIAGEATGTITIGGTSVTGKGDLDVLLAKYDSTGVLVWAKRYGSYFDDAAKSICSDGAGNLYVAGYFSDKITFGSVTLDAGSSNTSDAFIAKFDGSDGTCLWAVQVGGTGEDYANGIAYANGYLYVTGGFNSSMSVGSTTLTSAGSSDVFLAKYDVAGNAVWATSDGGTTSDVGRGINVDASGNVYVTGYFSNNAQFGGINHTAVSLNNADDFWMKYDGAGNFMSFKDMAGNGGEDILIDAAGNVYSAGGKYTISSYGGVSTGLCFAQNGNILSTGHYTTNQGFDSYIFVAEFAKPAAVASVTSGAILSAYPNPVMSSLSVHGLAAGASIRLFDQTGRLVLQTVADGSAATIAMDDLAPGVYFLSADGVVIGVIKQ